MGGEAVFRLPDGLAARRWRLAGPEAHPPLVAGLLAQPPDAIAVGGYVYVRDDPEPGEAEAASGDGDWREAWLPEVEALIGSFGGLGAGEVGAGGWDEALRERFEAWAAVARGLREAVAVPAARALGAFEAAYAARYGEERRGEARALAAPLPSRAERRAEAVWELSRLLRSQGSRLSQTFGPTGGQREYLRRFDRAIGAFGAAAPGCRQDAAGWREDRALLTRAVREAAALPDAASPLAARRATLERRAAFDAAADGALRAAAAEARRLAAEPDALAEHAERLTAAARAAWLRLARPLAARGALPEPDAVFLLERAELAAALEGGDAPGAGELARRRAALEAYAAAGAPPRLGGDRDGARYASPERGSSPSEPGS